MTECELETKLGNWTSEFMIFDGKEYEMKNLIANYEFLMEGFLGWKGQRFILLKEHRIDYLKRLLGVLNQFKRNAV